MSDLVLVPRKLTAENGAKYLMIGEFYENLITNCTECTMIDVGCEACDDTGEIEFEVLITWDTIKKIHDRMVAYFSGSES